MTRERWEARCARGLHIWHSLSRADCVAARDERAKRGIVGDRLVHVRTYRVEVVYAWRRILGGYYDRHGLIVFTTKAARIYTDPLGKHSRRRAKAAALAAKPAGPCVLVAIRRRVKEQ